MYNVTQRLSEELRQLANVTSRQPVLLLEDIHVVKGRLKIAAILSFTQLAIVIVYFITVGILYIKKCVKKHQGRLRHEELELMDHN